jgi:UDP-N-acetylglucosamine 2-epimerase (non-hydrolysing)
MRASFSVLRDLVARRRDVRLLYPVHPNPSVRAMAREVLAGVDRIHLVEPLDYFPFVAAMKAAALIVTDSGGVQEEAPWLRKPVLVLREETERPEAVAAGVARLVGTKGPALRAAMDELLDDPVAYARMAGGGSPYGDGRAAARIVQRVRAHLGLPSEHAPLAPFGSADD